MNTYHINNIILSGATVKEALEKLNNLPTRDSLTLFVVDNDKKLVGALTDGDIRRGLLQGRTIEDKVESIMNKKFKFLQRNNFAIDYIDELKSKEIDLIPFLNSEFVIEKIIDLTKVRSILPLDAVIMAGGEGLRLRPLTNNTPKPLLLVGDTPILERNIDRLVLYGVDNFHLSLNYLGEKIKGHFGDGKNKSVNISYTEEKEACGTIGAVSLIEEFLHDEVLIMNSDLLTNIDFEDFYKSFKRSGADMSVATIPYQISLPYGVIESEENRVISIKEKPTYTYYSNAGIYIVKKELLSVIPKHKTYNATDLLQHCLDTKHAVYNYPILGYWLDIGKHEDFIKAQEDIKHLKF